MHKGEAKTSTISDESVREHIRKMLRQIPRLNDGPHLIPKRAPESYRIAVEVE